MKKTYVVRLFDGYIHAEDKQSAIETCKDNFGSDVIYTASVDGNYYHNQVNVVFSNK